jgi:hypothetical protein
MDDQLETSRHTYICEEEANQVLQATGMATRPQTRVWPSSLYACHCRCHCHKLGLHFFSLASRRKSCFEGPGRDKRLKHGVGVELLCSFNGRLSGFEAKQSYRSCPLPLRPLVAAITLCIAHSCPRQRRAPTRCRPRRKAGALTPTPTPSLLRDPSLSLTRETMARVESSK